MGLARHFLPWADPLALAQAQTGDFALLLSSTKASYSGRYSYLACAPDKNITAESFAPLAELLSASGERFANAWFGYLGYELRHDIEPLADAAPSYVPTPRLRMLRPSLVYQFDHELKRITLWAPEGMPIPAIPTTFTPHALPAVSSLGSNMTRSEYLQKAQTVLEHIHQGNLYQANLTRKFTGEFEQAPDALSLFSRLCSVSPAPYSSLLRFGDMHIASSSPELFLRMDAQGHVSTRPIKGTAPRFSDQQQDEASRNELADSEKNRAENLMIVDLMRNDLSHTAKFGSVQVDSLFDVTTHATIHHMSSTVSAQKNEAASCLDVIRSCFPPGSMTGAPKIAAMQLCNELEGMERGAYSGAIGWLGGDGACELSVVIRTLICQGRKFEFQVGGGIVADSTPESELQETFDKARGILACLGLKRDDLERL